MGFVAMCTHTPDSSPRWYHTPNEPRPPEYTSGPLVGTQLFLAKIICPVFGHAVDRRALHDLGLDGFLWIVKSPRRQCCQVYFREQHLYAEANARRLALESKQNQA
jgi:hypothetical protein